MIKGLSALLAALIFVAAAALVLLRGRGAQGSMLLGLAYRKLAAR